MKKFNIPPYFKSSFISSIKEVRKQLDPRKKNFTPAEIDFGPVRFFVARHFGFCYGVENAIEISYRAVEENPNKRIFLLSQMIHNPEVNRDLQKKGIQFIMDTSGNQIIPWENITNKDIVIIPAFGTTVEIEEKLTKIGIAAKTYNTTCPFVEKVWKMGQKLGESNYSVIIHGKKNHEETRATFSHSEKNAPSVIIKDINEAQIIGQFIKKNRPIEDFYQIFESRFSKGFNPEKDLNRLGVINQTTMLATETQEIAAYLKNVIVDKFGEENYKDHFADTRDTLCYATNDNQEATYGLLKKKADLAIVVGGYNSSNTSHIVELCEQKLPTYFISSADKITSKNKIEHFNYHTKEIITTSPFLDDNKNKVDIILTSGASCPDALVDQVIDKIVGLFSNTKTKKEILEKFCIA